MDYRIEDLSRIAHTTVRNVRAYQERGLVAPPRREGRIAWYGEAHLARIRKIGALLERGYTLANIGDLLGSAASQNELRDLLGLEAALSSPFSDEVPEVISLEKMQEMFGVADPEALARALEVGLFEIRGTSLVAPSMRLVRVGAELYAAGIPLAALLAELASLKQAVNGIAEGFVNLVATNVISGIDLKRITPAEEKRLVKFVERARPMAEVAVDTMLAQALEAVVKKELSARLGERATARKKRGARQGPSQTVRSEKQQANAAVSAANRVKIRAKKR